MSYSHQAPGQRRLKAAAATAVGCAMLLSAGCTSSGKPVAQAPPSVSASPSSDPDEAAKQQVLATYRGLWAAVATIYKSGSMEGANGAELQKFAAGKALAGVRASEVYYQDQGLVLKGDPVLSPKVTSIDMAATPPTAQITSCVDSTDFIPVDKKTGTPAKLASNEFRHVENSTAVGGNGAWLITELVIQRDQSC
ncbi:hypothetical protein KNE206_30240 [Kitasatospora sp. NE20-6]|uniref:hypothetical protein n=1 Tax=Kitasatospora sp. NE20-6 TaxID=2859066 RepID=UPI0034DBEEF8